MIYFCTRAIYLSRFISEKLRTLIRNANIARGTTASALHPCHLLPPSILASPSCTLPFYIGPEGPIFSSFSPSGPSRSLCSLCTASRLLLLLLSLLLLFLLLHLLPPPLSPSRRFLSLLSLSLRLRFSSSRDSFLFFLSLSFVPLPPPFQVSPVAPFVFVE